MSLLFFNSGCSDCTDSRGQKCLNSPQPQAPPSMYGMSAPLPVKVMKHTGNSGIAVGITADGGCTITKMAVLLFRWHKILWKAQPDGEMKEAVFGYSSREALSLRCRLVIINPVGKAVEQHQWAWEKSYIQFPSTSHTCVQGPCLHKRWLTNDMDSQTITMMNLAFSLVKKKKQKHPQSSDTCFHTHLFFIIGEKIWFTLSDIKHTSYGRQKNTSLQC